MHPEWKYRYLGIRMEPEWKWNSTVEVYMYTVKGSGPYKPPYILQDQAFYDRHTSSEASSECEPTASLDPELTDMS